MLTGLRARATSWVAQVLLGMLVLSFAIWGVSDIFRGFNVDTVARVGTGEITATDFQTAYQSQLQRYGEQFGQVITPDLARQMGLSDQVMAQLISEELIAVQADQFGIGVSNEKLGELIRALPSLQGSAGFDRNRLETLLYQNGWTERQFVQLVRDAQIQQQIQSGVSGGIEMPAILGRAMQQIVGETRDVSYVVLQPELAGDIPAPTDEQLTAFMAEAPGRWRAPEYRGLVVLSAAVADLTDLTTVTPEEVRAEYDGQTARFIEPEERAIKQLLFRDRAAADAALARLRSGDSFDAVFTDPTTGGAAVDLGIVTKAEILDPAIAEVAFAPEGDTIRGVIEGRFGFVVLLISAVVPEVVTPFEEVQAQIRDELAAERAANEILDLYERVEDARAGGSTLAEIGETMNLPVRIVPEINRDGEDLAGQPIERLPDRPDLLAATFESDVGLENDPIETRDGGYLWYEVTGVVPARDRSLDEVREELTTAWREREISNRLVDQATAIAARVRAGEAMQAVAAELGLTVATASNVTRRGIDTSQLSNAARSAAFAGPNGHVAIAPGTEPGSQMVLKVEAASVPPVDPAINAQLGDVAGEIGGDLMQQYLAYLQTEYGTTVNNTLIQQIIGGGSF